MRVRCSLVTLALLVVALWTPSAQATTVKCQRIIAKAGALYAQTRMKALVRCEYAAVLAGGGTCPDQTATDAIATARAKLGNAIGKVCGGVDLACGGDTTLEDSPASLGWPSVCPNFERGDCDGDITDCGDIATCLACVADATVGAGIDLAYGDLALPSADPLNLCQRSIGKAMANFFIAKTKALQKCWDARLNGKHGGDCVPPALGDGKYLAAIDKAELKKMTLIAKACGGPDDVFGGGDDLTPPMIGFPAECPAVTIPGGLACAGPVTTVQQLAECVDCVTEFHADCGDRLQVPEFVPAYPGECNVCPLPPPSGPCPTQLQLTADGPHVDLDLGWTGLGHDGHLPTNGRLTLAIAGCAGTSQPTCGQCSLSGPLPNDGGPAFDNHRCVDASWVTCTTDGDCTDAGAAGPCVYYLGQPIPGVGGGISTCVLNHVEGSISGTVDLDDGTATTIVPLSSTVHVTGAPFHPCPNCVAGTCDAGPRSGLACTVGGTAGSGFGDVSLDCPPDPGFAAGTFTSTFLLSTGSQSRTVTTANPNCTMANYTTRRCLCSTCNNLDQQPCATNADCPISGGNPGICGGRRCLGGANAGAPCSATSECPAGSCDRPGERTKPNACLDDCATIPDETLCLDTGDGEGECPLAPVDRVCSLQPHISCGSAADCQPSITCPDCLPGQECRDVMRPCFTDNGVIGDAVFAEGMAETPCGGAAKPTLGSLFCVAPVESPSVNVAIGLPGLGRVRVPATMTLVP